MLSSLATLKLCIKNTLHVIIFFQMITFFQFTKNPILINFFCHLQTQILQLNGNMFNNKVKIKLLLKPFFYRNNLKVKMYLYYLGKIKLF